MVCNHYIKCQVCNSTTRIRIQLGWLEEHPVVITCGKCGTSLSGVFKQRQNGYGTSIHFNNADIVYTDNEDYIVECSGEFPTLKQIPVQNAQQYPLTPFTRAMIHMESDNSYIPFCEAVRLVMDIKQHWTYYKRILDLSSNLENPYLIQEIHKVFGQKKTPCKKKLETLQALHMIVRLFIKALRTDIYIDEKFSKGIINLNHNQLKLLIDFLNTNTGYSLKEMQTQTYKMLDEFLNVFQALIPALALQYYKDDINYENEGSTTSNFDNIKQFYLNAYETLGNLIIIPVALNNIEYRNNYDSLYPFDEKNFMLFDFISVQKANRYKYCQSKEKYTEKLKIVVNSKLRNAIGHNDVKYDTISQKITYIPDPKNRKNVQNEYLLEFEGEALKLFQGLLVTSEYLYRLQQIAIIQEGKSEILTVGQK